MEGKTCQDHVELFGCPGWGSFLGTFTSVYHQLASLTLQLVATPFMSGSSSRLEAEVST